MAIVFDALTILNPLCSTHNPLPRVCLHYKRMEGERGNNLNPPFPQLNSTKYSVRFCVCSVHARGGSYNPSKPDLFVPNYRGQNVFKKKKKIIYI